MPERTLTVNIIGDDADLRRAFARSSGDAKKFQGQVGVATTSLSRGFAAAGIAAGATSVSLLGVTAALRRSVSTASDLVEQTAKSQTVFGDASAEVEKFARSASNIGIARNEALGAAGALGNMITALGLGEKKAAAMSIRMVQLAADMGSFNNEDPSAMLERIRSGLSGEMEPLRRYGSILSATRVEQFAWANGIADTGEKLTEQQKVLGRYGLLLQDTAKQQGDIERTQGSLANQTRKLNAQMADLSATVGGVLTPALLEVVVSTNHFIEATGRAIVSARNFRSALMDLGKDIPDIPEPPDWLRTFVFSDDARTLLFGGGDGGFTPGDRVTGPDRGLGDERSSAAEIAEERARAAEELERTTTKTAGRQRKAFDAFIKGMGLKLDKARLTESLANDNAVLREMERAILRQIGREGKTFELVDQLTQVRLQLSSNSATKAEEGTRREREALDKIAAAEDKAQEDRRRLAEKLRARRQEDQFKEIGLTGEGAKPVPGVAALKQRLGNIRDQVKGTALDTDKTKSQLDAIARVLRGKFKGVGKEVRSAILEMFNDISNALNDGGDKVAGPLTKTTSLNSKKILAGLGLSPDEIRELRGRLSNFNSSGVGLAGAQTSGTGSFRGGGGDVVVETTINLDGDAIARAVTRRQQKNKRRNPKQKRGPNRIR